MPITSHNRLRLTVANLLVLAVAMLASGCKDNSRELPKSDDDRAVELSDLDFDRKGEAAESIPIRPRPLKQLPTSQPRVPGGLSFGPITGNSKPPSNDKGKDLSNYITVAVADFQNHSMNSDLDGFRLGFRDMLVTSLTKLSSVRIVERARLKALLDEHKLSTSAFIDANTVVKLGKGLAAQQILTGAFTILDEKIQIDVRLISVETGEVLFGESIAGKTTDLFSLQKTLFQKVVTGLSVSPTSEEFQVINASQVKSFAAFSEFAAARLAQINGEEKEARRRFKRALQLDPTADLVSTELNRLESAALFRVEDSRQQQARAAGAIQQQLDGHIDKHHKIAGLNRRDPQYFASLLVISSYYGLWGQYKKELESLWEFWRQFSESVDPKEADVFFQEIGNAIKSDTLFFQETIHSGNFNILIAFSSSESEQARKQLLADPLTDVLYWPKWSRLWPFNDAARTSFGQSTRYPDNLLMKAVFQKQLPHHAHHFLDAMLGKGPNIADVEKNLKPGGTDYWEFFKVKTSILAYLTMTGDPPTDIINDIERLSQSLLRDLEGMQLQELGSSKLKNVIKVLELIATIGSSPQFQNRANKLLITSIKQLRIDEGIPDDSRTNPPSANPFGFQFDGKNIVIIWHVPEFYIPSPSDMPLSKQLFAETANIIRDLPSSASVGFKWIGYIDDKDSEQDLFPLRPATPATKTKLFKLLGNRVPSGSRRFGPNIDSSLIEISDSTTEKTHVLLIAEHHNHVKILKSTTEALKKNKSIVFHLIVRADQESLLKWSDDVGSQLSKLKFEKDRGLFGTWNIIPYKSTR